MHRYNGDSSYLHLSVGIHRISQGGGRLAGLIVAFFDTCIFEAKSSRAAKDRYSTTSMYGTNFTPKTHERYSNLMITHGTHRLAFENQLMSQCHRLMTISGICHRLMTISGIHVIMGGHFVESKIYLLYIQHQPRTYILCRYPLMLRVIAGMCFNGFETTCGGCGLLFSSGL